MATTREWFRGHADNFRTALSQFGEERGPLIAAGISFYTIITLLPLLLFAVAILGYVVGSSGHALTTVNGYLSRMAPGSGFTSHVLRGLVQQRGTLTWIAILALLWTGSQFFVTLEMALNGIWHNDEKPGFVRSRIKGILMIVAFGILMLLSIGSSSLVRLVHTAFAGVLGSGVVGVLLSVAAVVLAIAFAVMMFAVVYKWVPDARVTWRSALYGAVVAGLAWEVAKELYAIYIAHFANFSKLYGSIGGLIILVMWIYYSSMILVFGATLASAHYDTAQAQRPQERRLRRAS